MDQVFSRRTRLHCNALLPITDSLLLVGQYELNDDRRNRNLREGRVDLFELHERAVNQQQQQQRHHQDPNAAATESAATESAEGATTTTATAKPQVAAILVSTVKFPGSGVFDLVSLADADDAADAGCVALAACTDGSVKFLRLNATAPRLTVLCSLPMGEQMVTSCFYDSARRLVVACHHQGSVSVRRMLEADWLATLVAAEAPASSPVLTFDAHQFDAWTVAMSWASLTCSSSTSSSNNDFVFFSGGDDAKLKIWDCSAMQMERKKQSASATTKKKTKTTTSTSTMTMTEDASPQIVGVVGTVAGGGAASSTPMAAAAATAEAKQERKRQRAATRRANEAESIRQQTLGLETIKLELFKQLTKLKRRFEEINGVEPTAEEIAADEDMSEVNDEFVVVKQRIKQLHAQGEALAAQQATGVIGDEDEEEEDGEEAASATQNEATEPQVEEAVTANADQEQRENLEENQNNNNDSNNSNDDNNNDDSRNQGQDEAPAEEEQEDEAEEGEEDVEAVPPTCIAAATFGAGVVSIVPVSEHTVIVGTYDEQVHLVDLRRLTDAPRSRRMRLTVDDVALSTVRVGGGAWRIRELSAVTVRALCGGLAKRAVETASAMAAIQADEEPAAAAAAAGDGASATATTEEAVAAAVASPSRIFAVAAMHVGSHVIGLDAASGELHNMHWRGRPSALHHTALKWVKKSATTTTRQQQNTAASSSSSASSSCTTSSSTSSASSSSLSSSCCSSDDDDEYAQGQEEEEPLIYDVAELIVAGRPVVATVSFYTNELTMWA